MIDVEEGDKILAARLSIEDGLINQIEALLLLGQLARIMCGGLAGVA